ncbi:dockerin type I domain-containing protein [Haloarchaeobius sp. DYHT-AS-18]|uniref:dockerin type I domain-containing protein n=1 Tax=Haloarchaeobius sp. DYHT-AS-18 TaxID=3446117 RepID=UPI003EB89BF3
MSSRSIATVTLAVLLAVSFATPMAGTVAADDHAAHDVRIDTTTLTSGTEQMVEITVTNNQSSDMVSPVVEIPLRNGLSVADDRRSTDGSTEFVDGVTVTTSSGTVSRTAFIDDSSFRGTDALYVEGVVVPAGESRTYTVPLTVSGSNEITLETDVRPLNNVDQNVRVSRSIEPTVPGTIDASYASGSGDITVSGSAIDSQTGSDSVETDVPSGQSYDVSTTLSGLDETVTISGLQVGEFETETVRFVDPSQRDSLSPMVVGRTSSQASVVDGSVIRSTSDGTAETRTTQTVTFDLVAGGGQTVVAVGTDADLPMASLSSTTGVDDARFATDAAPGVAILNTSGAVDTTVTVQLQGRYLGDVDADDTVDGNDASSIAAALASNSTDSLTEYADVNDDGEVSAIDAMQTQQYAEGNRTADYSNTTDEEEDN